jgi:hypothetical protein
MANLPAFRKQTQPSKFATEKMMIAMDKQTNNSPLALVKQPAGSVRKPARVGPGKTVQHRSQRPRFAMEKTTTVMAPSTKKVAPAQ